MANRSSRCKTVIVINRDDYELGCDAFTRAYSNMRRVLSSAKPSGQYKVYNCALYNVISMVSLGVFIEINLMMILLLQLSR